MCDSELFGIIRVFGIFIGALLIFMWAWKA